jgi:hypothetical protein
VFTEIENYIKSEKGMGCLMVVLACTINTGGELVRSKFEGRGKVVRSKNSGARRKQ